MVRHWMDQHKFWTPVIVILITQLHIFINNKSKKIQPLNLKQMEHTWYSSQNTSQKNYQSKT